MLRSSDTRAGPTSRLPESREMHSANGARLLSIGEIFDRAVHLTVANLLPLVAIVGLVAAPTRAIADWLDRDNLTRYFGAFGIILADPKMLPNFYSLISDPHGLSLNWPFQVWLVASRFPLALAIAAASIASQEFIKGKTLTLDAAYRAAMARLAPVIGASVLSWAMYLAAILVAAAPWFAWLQILQARGEIMSSASVAEFSAVFFSLFAAAVVWITPLANCTFVGAALFMIRPFRALGEAWTMTMSRGLRVRTLAFGAAFLAFSVGQGFINLALSGFLSNVTHSPWLSFVASDAIRLLVSIFSVALAVVFCLDARNRIGLIQDPLANRENRQSQ
jgi:hypothetical protein